MLKLFLKSSYKLGSIRSSNLELCSKPFKLQEVALFRNHHLVHILAFKTNLDHVRRRIVVTFFSTVCFIFLHFFDLEINRVYIVRVRSTKLCVMNTLCVCSNTKTP